MIKMTAQEQDLINTIAKNLHNNIEITPEQIAQITPEMLNSLVTSGEDSGLYLAFVLAYNETGSQILYDNTRLANAIDAKILNDIVETGEHSGESVAFWLATYFSQSLNVESCNLGQSINEEALNKHLYKTDVKDDRYMAVMTAAFHLSKSSEIGHKVLSADNYKLSLKITARTLNQINQHTLNYSDDTDGGADIYVGQSTASVLAETESGCQILSAHNDRLAKMITPELLNGFH